MFFSNFFSAKPEQHGLSKKRYLEDIYTYKHNLAHFFLSRSYRPTIAMRTVCWPAGPCLPTMAMRAHHWPAGLCLPTIAMGRHHWPAGLCLPMIAMRKHHWPARLCLPMIAMRTHHWPAGPCLPTIAMRTHRWPAGLCLPTIAMRTQRTARRTTPMLVKYRGTRFHAGKSGSRFPLMGFFCLWVALTS